MCIVPQSYLNETFWRPPAPGRETAPPLLYSRSQLVLLYQDLPGRGALGRLKADLGPGVQFCVHNELLLDSAFCNLLAYLKNKSIWYSCKPEFYDQLLVFWLKLLSVF